MARPRKQKEQPVQVREVSPWGEISSEVAPDAYRDSTFVKGYSDARTQFDLEASQGGHPQPLPYRLQYVPVEKQNGVADNTKVAYYRTRGYIPVEFDKLAAYGLSAEESGFVKGVDGTCRLGSQMLMICPAQKVAVHAKMQREATEALQGMPLAQMQRAAAEYTGKVQGATGSTKDRADVWQEEEVGRETK